MVGYHTGSREVIVKVFMSLFTCTLGKTGSLVQVHIMYTFQGQLEIKKKSSINGAMLVFDKISLSLFETTRLVSLH